MGVMTGAGLTGAAGGAGLAGAGATLAGGGEKCGTLICGATEIADKIKAEIMLHLAIPSRVKNTSSESEVTIQRTGQCLSW